MSFLKNLFSKSSPKLYVANLNQKIDYAFSVIWQFTPLVRDGINDINKLKHSKELIKNSILFLYRELKREPGKTYILEKHLKLKTKEKYIQYLDLLSQMLIVLANFSLEDTLDLDNNVNEITELNPSDPNFVNNIKSFISRNTLDTFISKQNESMKEYEYYFSELSAIDMDIKNGTNFKKINFYDMEY